MANNNQAKKEGNRTTIHQKFEHHYNNVNTLNKSTSKNNTEELKDVLFTQGRPYDYAKYKDSIDVLIKDVQ